MRYILLLSLVSCFEPKEVPTAIDGMKCKHLSGGYLEIYRCENKEFVCHTLLQNSISCVKKGGNK